MPTCNGSLPDCSNESLNDPCNTPCQSECTEIISTNCIIYDGPTQPALDVVTNTEFNSVITAIDVAIGLLQDCCDVNVLTFAVDALGTDFDVNEVAGAVTISLPDASPTARGVVTTTDQTFGGCKTTTIFATSEYFANPQCSDFLAKQSVTNNNLHLGKNRDRTVSGTKNTLVGTQTVAATTHSASSNTLVGYNAGAAITTGGTNTFVGSIAGETLTTGTFNTGLGQKSLNLLQSGTSNTGVGSQALANVTTGSYNTSLGMNCLQIATGNRNIGIGYAVGTIRDSLLGLTSGSNNILIGTVATANGAISDSISFGYNSDLFQSNCMVVGSNDSPIYDIFLGQGQYDNTATTPSDVTIHSSGCRPVTSTDGVGANLILQGGDPTGNGKAGDIVFKGNAYSTASGTAARTSMEAVRYRGTSVSTTTATTTVIDSYITSSNKTTTFNVRIVAKGTTTDSAFYNFVATFNNNGGAVTQVGTTTKLVEHETVGGWNMDFNINGTSVETRVISTAMNISWVMSAEIFTV